MFRAVTKTQESSSPRGNYILAVNRKQMKKHAKQKIKDIPKRIVSRGIGFVSNFLDNLKKKWVK